MTYSLLKHIHHEDFVFEGVGDGHVVFASLSFWFVVLLLRLKDRLGDALVRSGKGK